MDAQLKEEEQALKDVQSFVRKSQERLDRARKSLPQEVYKRIQSKLNDLRHAIRDGKDREMETLQTDISALLGEYVEESQKSVWREYAESIALAIVFALILRGFVIEAFKIPSGSMIPTLIHGDQLFVNKFIYGLRVPFTQSFLLTFKEPERGEVVVFTFPVESARAHLGKQPISRQNCVQLEEKDFIKRVIGTPGDTVELRANRLFLNGSPIESAFLDKKTTGNYQYPHTIQEVEKLGDHEYIAQYKGTSNNFGPIKVKPGHLFVMGDNRDRSADSRCWGQVPRDFVKGRAMFIWWSSYAGEDGTTTYSLDRIGQGIQ